MDLDKLALNQKAVDETCDCPIHEGRRKRMTERLKAQAEHHYLPSMDDPERRDPSTGDLIP